MLFIRMTISAMFERRRRQLSTCVLGCILEQFLVGCWDRSAGSMTSGPQMSQWPTKWRLEVYLGESWAAIPGPIGIWKNVHYLLCTLEMWLCPIDLYSYSTRRVHISQSTLECLHGEFDVEPGNGGDRCEYLRERGIETYLVLVPKGPVSKNGINGVVSVISYLQTKHCCAGEIAVSPCLSVLSFIPCFSSRSCRSLHLTGTLLCWSTLQNVMAVYTQPAPHLKNQRSWIHG